ncbi:DUF308 domain-containing protein [Galbitalea sp. SE-J8]|uniref:HdeD family acid-resistance protein n=1 Tax=Galbitalea sp. SE-J8 TaxID=3054952 RepID=UPI00259D1812|nr:DUF308 domain-containing protein [Galbitalea sp. SE-J8]MDM4762595.1 DUF308 domain-containing protein [Galbitalea sp. SE-J8]
MSTPEPGTPSTDRPVVVDLAWLRRVHRGQIIALAIVGLVLGIVGFVFPVAAVATIAVIFGASLVAIGLFRILLAIVSVGAGAAMRWLSAVLGLFIVIAGVVTLSRPYESILILAFVIGTAWILDGVTDFMLGLRGVVQPRWFGFLSGIVSIAAGVAFFVLPATSTLVLLHIGSILLVAVAVTTLLTLPRAPKRA